MELLMELQVEFWGWGLELRGCEQLSFHTTKGTCGPSQ